jgi:ribosome-binding protein aMBF1 (putative translation factor)
MEPAVQVENVARIERELDEARRAAGRALRETREAKGISLRAAAKGIRLSPGSLSELERGRSWMTRTAQRAARFLERVA